MFRRSRTEVSSPVDLATVGPPSIAISGHEGTHTVTPALLDKEEVRTAIGRIEEREPALADILRGRLAETLRIRKLLRRHADTLAQIVGGENLSCVFALREGFSTDSTGRRGFITEAVVSPPRVDSLRQFMCWCFRHRVPIIPYGAGGGYNMGVVPMAPAVTLWTGALRKLWEPIPHPHPHGRARRAVWAEAGVPYGELVDSISKLGMVVRCAPNTPRASVGGVVATGSNGGKRIADILLAGEAVLPDGRLVEFETSEQERHCLAEQPFPLLHKFSGVSRTQLKELKVLLESGGILPASLFVAAEGTTGVITRVLLEVEDQPGLGLSVGIWLPSLEQVPPLAMHVHKLPEALRPVYFELLTDPAISHYLAPEYPDLFEGNEPAYVIATFEADTATELASARRAIESFLHEQVRTVWVGPYPTSEVPPEASRLKEPREALPTKLTTKCKADIEIRLEALPSAIRLLSEKSTPKNERFESILFGHLSLRDSAVIHWNIGGVDLAVEEQAEQAWGHLEKMLKELMKPDATGTRHAAFTGEHGAAGKPLLFRLFLSRPELARMHRIKRLLDPRRLINPYTLFLPTRLSRSLAARTLALPKSKGKANRGAAELVQLCTRCNACQNCLVLDSQALLRTSRKPRANGEWILGKRHIVLLLELLMSSEISRGAQKRLLEESVPMLRQCISCGRCDDVCPADIQLSDLKAELWKLLGREPALPIRSRFLYRFLLAPAPRFLPMVFQGFLTRFTNPLARFLQVRKPSWGSLWAYAAMPPMEGRRYTAPKTATIRNIGDDLALHGSSFIDADHNPLAVRFRGCVGTMGRTQATRNEDRFFFERAGIPFLDFVPDLCCGYPYQAAGAYDEARSRRDKLIHHLAGAIATAKRLLGDREFVLISSCPTCQESLRKGLKENPDIERSLSVADPAEFLLPFLPNMVAQSEDPRIRIGLKIPCHATPEATEAQLRLLKRHGVDVVEFDQCCGMAGTGRIMHPEIGHLLATKLAKEIIEERVSLIVSGCPSCRDGVLLQSTLTGTELTVTDLFGFLLSLENTHD